MPYIKPPETAEEHVEAIHHFLDLLQTAFIESGFELSIAEQIDVFQYYFIDQWENYESNA